MELPLRGGENEIGAMIQKEGRTAGGVTRRIRFCEESPFSRGTRAS